MSRRVQRPPNQGRGYSVRELTSVGVDGGAVKAHGLVGPFERDFQMWMDASPRDEIVFTICRESPHELWIARLR